MSAQNIPMGSESHAEPRSRKTLIWGVTVALFALVLVALSVVVIKSRQSPCDEWRERFHDALVKATTSRNMDDRLLPTIVESERPEGC